MPADEGGIELAHGQAGDPDVAPQHFAVAAEHGCTVQLMGLAGQRQQMATRAFHIGGFMKNLVAE